MPINLPSAIKIGGRFPLDAKYWVASYANLNDGEIYEGIHRWTLDTGIEYVLQQDLTWRLTDVPTPGPAGTITVGTVAGGEVAAISNSGTASAAILNFTLPKGDTGNTPIIDIGTVTNGLTPLVSNVGTTGHAILNFQLPTGIKGDTGVKGDSAWVAYSANVDGSFPNYTLNTQHKYVSFLVATTQPNLTAFTTWVLFKGADGGPAGASAYQTWLTLGNTGTIEDFVRSLIGSNGQSAYQVWLGLGNTGTQQDFINSLQGNSSAYTLPVASSTIRGGLKLGTGFTVTNTDNVSVAFPAKDPVYHTLGQNIDGGIDQKVVTDKFTQVDTSISNLSTFDFGSDPVLLVSNAQNTALVGRVDSWGKTLTASGSLGFIDFPEMGISTLGKVIGITTSTDKHEVINHFAIGSNNYMLSAGFVLAKETAYFKVTTFQAGGPHYVLTRIFSDFNSNVKSVNGNLPNSSGDITVSVSGGGGPATTDALPEGSTNKYFTNSRAISAQLTNYARNNNPSTTNIIGPNDTLYTAIQKLAVSDGILKAVTMSSSSFTIFDSTTPGILIQHNNTTGADFYVSRYSSLIGTYFYVQQQGTGSVRISPFPPDAAVVQLNFVNCASVGVQGEIRKLLYLGNNQWNVTRADISGVPLATGGGGNTVTTTTVSLINYTATADGIQTISLATGVVNVFDVNAYDSVAQSSRPIKPSHLTIANGNLVIDIASQILNGEEITGIGVNGGLAVAGTGLSNFQIRTVTGTRVAQIPIVSKFRITAENFFENVTSAIYQLNTRVDKNSAWTAGQSGTISEMTTQIQALTSAQLVVGQELEIQTVAIIEANPARLVITLE